MSLDSWGIFLKYFPCSAFLEMENHYLWQKNRAKEAASELVNIAKIEKNILLVGHGFIDI